MLIGEYCSNGCEDLTQADEFVCGTEYEIEHVKEVLNPDGDSLPFSLHEDTQWWDDLGWQRDGSLRNNGIEVVTHPVTFDEALKDFKKVHEYVHVGELAYTHRTSTHVHVNVQNLSDTQVKTLTMLYALFENVFFNFVGPVRANNIHCVPLNYTYLPNKYSRPLTELVETWSKYTAFNLCPVRTLGTVEFRHLYGTGDYEIYKQWLTLLRSLWNFVYENPTFNLYEYLLNNGDVKHLQYSIFGLGVPLVDTSSTVIDVKLAFV